jgi:hypothetical protein
VNKIPLGHAGIYDIKAIDILDRIPESTTDNNGIEYKREAYFFRNVMEVDDRNNAYLATVFFFEYKNKYGSVLFHPDGNQGLAFKFIVCRDDENIKDALEKFYKSLSNTVDMILSGGRPNHPALLSPPSDTSPTSTTRRS